MRLVSALGEELERGHGQDLAAGCPMSRFLARVVPGLWQDHNRCGQMRKVRGCRCLWRSAKLRSSGGMTERTKVLVLKTSEAQASVGSNPTPSATLLQRSHFRLCRVG